MTDPSTSPPAQPLQTDVAGPATALVKPTERQHRGQSVFWFATTTLLGAFLVFQVQPVISKCVLPWFGGTPAVWTTCMLFFQLLLFGGYLYAHLLRSCCRPATQAAIHLTLLASAVLALPIEPDATWKPMGSESPTLFLLWMLAAHVGLPYFVLSSTGPLVQAWLSYQDHSDRVYRLYALSNAGSLFALLSYPFLFEPVLSVSAQSDLWSLLFFAFVLIQGMVAVRLFRLNKQELPPLDATQSPSAHDTASPADKASWRTPAAWLGLPALASVMLLIVTNHVCQDVAVVPFLWVLPLSLYLASFIICFDSPHWYRPKLVATITLVAIGVIQVNAWIPGPGQLISLVVSFMVLLFGVCLICHGEVARLKPRSSRLTQYYAFMSAGGALGGIIVAVLCPLVFDTFAELPVSLVLVTALSFVLYSGCRGWRRAEYDWAAAYRLRYGLAGLLIAPMIGFILTGNDTTIASERNFFGVLRVTRENNALRLVHGTTVHGVQRFGKASHEPTTYYGRQSGVGIAIAELQKGSPSLRIGIVGLGCGVLTTYGRSGDEFDIIEINPAVVDIANNHFTFMRECPSTIHHHLGDGRLVLERMSSKKFDLLVLDAFSSDAIPAHLLTREAVRLFRERLAEGGVIAVHVSNNHLDLVPLVHRLSVDAGMTSRVVRSGADKQEHIARAKWVLITATQSNPLWNQPSLSDAEPATAADLADAPFWTDQHHNLVSVLRIW